MFVFSVKTSVRQLVRIGCGFAIVMTALVLTLCLPSGDALATSAHGRTDDERVQYLATLGYTADPASVEVRELTIPDEFDAVFAEYNRLQQTAGMDLSPYRNQTVKRYTYAVSGHPQTDTALATLLVCKGKIIGGDVADTAADGFIQGLTPLAKE